MHMHHIKNHRNTLTKIRIKKYGTTPIPHITRIHQRRRMHDTYPQHHQRHEHSPTTTKRILWSRIIIHRLQISLRLSRSSNLKQKDNTLQRQHARMETRSQMVLRQMQNTIRKNNYQSTKRRTTRRNSITLSIPHLYQRPPHKNQQIQPRMDRKFPRHQQTTVLELHTTRHKSICRWYTNQILQQKTLEEPNRNNRLMGYRQ